MSVYKACDIRGPVTDLSEELYRTWGRLLAERTPAGSLFAVGGDVRESTPAFLQSLIEGLASADIRIVNLGIVPTPMVYFAKRTLDANACAVVTASHNPPHINGLKWMLGGFPPTPDDIEQIKARTAAAKETAPKPIADIQQLDLSKEYTAWLKEKFPSSGTASPMKIVLDPGNGCWSGRAVQYMREVFTSAELIGMNDRPDGRFPDRDPDSAKAENLTELAETVRRQNADLGIAFDGDGDRVSFVDNDGIVLSAEEATWVLLQSLRDQLPGRAFVYDIKFSERVKDAAEQLRAAALVEKSGHAHIRTRMLKENGLFGAEISGHYFYDHLHGGDDALYTACRMTAFLRQCPQSLADLRKQTPPVFMSPDLRLSMDRTEQTRLVSRLKDAFADHPTETVDGLRIRFKTGWALVRSSVTEPALTFRFEADSPQNLKTLITTVTDAMGQPGQKLQAKIQG